MTKMSTKSAYWFDQAAAIKQGKAYLISCEGGGEDTYAINSHGQIDIVVQNGFLGNDIQFDKIIVS